MVAESFASQLRAHMDPTNEYTMGPQDFSQILKFLKDNDIKVMAKAKEANPALTSLMDSFEEMGIAVN